MADHRAKVGIDRFTVIPTIESGAEVSGQIVNQSWINAMSGTAGVNQKERGIGSTPGGRLCGTGPLGKPAAARLH